MQRVKFLEGFKELNSEDIVTMLQLINKRQLLQLKQTELLAGNWHLLLLQAPMKLPQLLANW